MANKKPADNREEKIQVGNITGVSGEVSIAGRDIYKGYTAEQVSILLTQITSTFQPKPFDGHCPYKGLEVFEEEDAELFFGREQLVDDLVSRVKGSRSVFITGPSGSGKSSLVRAGLMPALKQGSIKNLHSERWLYETLKPGREPISELARAASSFAGTLSAGEDIRTKGMSDVTVLAQWCEIALKEGRDKRAVLFIDQFEEVFTQIKAESERQAFLNLLTHAATVDNGRVIVLFSMRSDFVSNCATYPQLNALLNQQFMQIGAMQPDELVSAIAQPALRVGLRIEPDLIAQIINDMQGEPGALPLMQFALKDLFDAEQSRGGMISLTREAYLQRGGIHKSLERHADNAFAKLSESEQELARSIFSGLIEIGRGTQDTRRTALFDELIPANTKDEDVQVTVQKLADARLITTDEQAGKDTVTISHEKLIDAWPWLRKLVNENRDAIALQNEIANDAKEWDEHNRDPSYLYTGARLINAREQLGAKKRILSGLSQEFVQAGHARQRRGQVSLIAGVSALIVLLVIAVIVFSRQSKRNADLAEQAHIRELTAQSVAWRERDLALSLLLGIEVFKYEDNVQARGLLLDNLQFNPQLLQFLRGHADSITSVAFSPDGKMLASGSSDNTIILWDAATHQSIGQPLAGHSGSINSVAFSPDGKMLASGSIDKTIIFWDVTTHQSIGQPLTGHLGSVYSIAFSPDGQMLASGSDDNSIILWDVATHQASSQPLRGHSGRVASLVFDPNGEILASGSYDNTILLWDLHTHQRIGQRLKGHSDWIFSVAFSPDGQMLASGSADKTVILWEIDTHHRIDKALRGNSGSVNSLAFNSDGKILASGSYNNTITFWDVNTYEPMGQSLTGHTNQVRSVTFNPDGKILASGSDDSTIILWDVATHQPIGQPLTGHLGSTYSLAFSPNGEMLASGSADKTVMLWDVNTHEPIGQPLTGHSSSVNSVAFSPDGTMLASGSGDNTIILWDVNTHEPIGQPLTGHSSSVNSVAFSPDGTMLASGSNDKTIMLWEVSTHQLIEQPLKEHLDRVVSVVFSPDGRMLISGSYDKTIILWDLATRRPIGQPLSGHSGSVHSVALSPDGNILASGSVDNTILLWDVDAQSWLAKTCQRAGRNLTRVEWAQNFPNEEYRKTCEQWPLDS